MRSLIIAAGVLVVSGNAAAQVSYTKEQLNTMVGASQFPEQGEVSNTDSRDMSFAGCKVAIETIMSQIRDEYPVRTMVDTSIMYTVKDK